MAAAMPIYLQLSVATNLEREATTFADTQPRTDRSANAISGTIATSDCTHSRGSSRRLQLICQTQTYLGPTANRRAIVRSIARKLLTSAMTPPFYQLCAKDIKGHEFDFSQLQGKVVLIVNVASK